MPTLNFGKIQCNRSSSHRSILHRNSDTNMDTAQGYGTLKMTNTFPRQRFTHAIKGLTPFHRNYCPMNYPNSSILIYNAVAVTTSVT